ncbi:hypothetical protein [Priestia aryabhattai]
MNKDNVISLEIVSGWCVAMVDPRTNEPGMYWDKRDKRFDGLLTIDSVFEKQEDASKVYEELAENPVVSYKIIPVDYRIINGHISTKLKK